MFKPGFLLSLFLVGFAVAFSAHASQQPFRLIQIFQDPNNSKPAEDLIYLLQLGGRNIGHGLTDESGSIVTEQRHPKTRQEFVADIWGVGARVIVVDSKNRATVKVLGNWEGLQDYASCSPKGGNCTGKGFYWIRLLGLGTKFASEPYSLTALGTTQEGAVDSNGYIFVPANSPQKVSDAIILRLCSGPAIQLKIGTNIEDSESDLVESSNVTAPPPKSCNASKLKNYSRHHADMNKGMPYIFSEWAIGSTPMELIEQQHHTGQALQDDYRALAAANNDRLAWLGALPPTWSDDEYSGRLDKFFDQLKSDMSFDMEDLLQFKCRTPAQVGPVPDMDAVEAYMNALSNNSLTHEVLDPLYVAAAKGNWLAVAQVYAFENQFNREDENPYLRNYRKLQLGEWLHARKIGVVYSELGHALNASGYITDSPFYYAALHNSYPSQFEMGTALTKGFDSRYHVIGQKMQSCALNALPAYRKHFEGTRGQ